MTFKVCNQARGITKKTNRDEHYRGNYLGSKARFVPVPGEEGKAVAKFKTPRNLVILPRNDCEFELHLNVSVCAKGKKSKLLLFLLGPESK